MSDYNSVHPVPKNYLLDISTLLYSPYAIHAFDDNNVIVPLCCIKELDRAISERTGDIRANAKECSRLLAALTECGGNLSKGVRLENNGTLRIIGDAEQDIYRVALEHKQENYIIVSRNPNVRIIANQKGIRAEDYKSEQASSDEESYLGRCTIYVSKEELETFKEKSSLKLDGRTKYTKTRPDGTVLPDSYKLTTNEFVILNGSTGGGTMLGRYNGKEIVPLRYMNQKNDVPVFGVKPRNVGQIFALEALLAPPDEAPLVILKGPAGTAKTFLTMAAALDRTYNNRYDDNLYRKILITRPNTKMDEDVGFLKGDEVSKVLPALRGLTDNIDNLLTTKPSRGARFAHGDDSQPESAVEELMARGVIDAQAMAYMRGRSICNQFVIVDEVQNATVTQVLSMITRIGENSKIVILGDPDQIDHPYLDRRNNGLSYAAEHMRGSKSCWQITFDESECTRSELASEAIARLTPKGAQF